MFLLLWYYYYNLISFIYFFVPQYYGHRLVSSQNIKFLIDKKSKITKSHIFISTEKPVMKGEIDLLPNKFENILSSINKLSNIKNSKKLKIILYLDKPLAVNNHGVLSLDKDVNLEIINLKLVLPII